jgi:hypothetical protein
MTPKEKAKELFDKFYSAIPSDEIGENYNSAKQCALIAVDEILEDNVDDMSWELFDIRIEYWQEVEREIENL